jgi:hypothetical protein
LQRFEDAEMRPILQPCLVGRLAVVHGNPLGSLCKPKVTGSIPVRSTENSAGGREALVTARVETGGAPIAALLESRSYPSRRSSRNGPNGR